MVLELPPTGDCNTAGTGDVNFDGMTNVLDVIASLNVIIGVTDPADIEDFECFQLSGKRSAHGTYLVIKCAHGNNSGFACLFRS